MTIGEYLGIPKRKGAISSSIKAKIRHSHAILVNAGKPKRLTAICLSGQYRISLSSFYKIVK